MGRGMASGYFGVAPSGESKDTVLNEGSYLISSVP